MKEVFPMAPAVGGSGLWLVWVIVLPILLFVGYLLYAPRSVQFEISCDGLRIRGDLFYGRFIPSAELDKGAARAIDLTVESQYKLAIRTKGTGLPGYKAGWFRLNNGEKVLAFISDPKRVVYVPVKSAYALMVSVPDTGSFLNALRRN